MTRKARIWTGVTLVIVLAFNYILLGFPLFQKASSVENSYKATLLKQAKSGSLLKGAPDEYILEVFRKERSAIEKKILILNSVAVSLLILVASWVVFGLVLHRRR